MPSKLASWCSHAWLGIVTAAIWLGIAGAGFATIGNGSGETGRNILVCCGVIVSSMIWGGTIVWSYRREPMRKVSTEIRDGQQALMSKLAAQDPERGQQPPAPLAVVRPFRRD